MPRKGHPMQVGPHSFGSIVECAAFFGRSAPNIRYLRERGLLEKLLDGPEKMHDGIDQPVEIHGIRYLSMSDAARSLGVSISAVSHAKKRGTLESLGAKQVFT
jgi:hypothetical protein